MGTEDPRPLGYWLQHLHGLLEEHFEATLAGLELSRRQWQLLNTLAASPRTRDELRTALAPFWSAGASDLDTALDGPTGLRTRGWARTAVDGTSIALTDAGRSGHAQAAARVRSARATVLGDDLTADDYHEAVRVLATMSSHVEAELAASRL